MIWFNDTTPLFSSTVMMYISNQKLSKSIKKNPELLLLQRTSSSTLEEQQESITWQILNIERYEQKTITMTLDA